MIKKLIIASSLIVALLLGYYAPRVLTFDELQSKREWATLQNVESDYREKPLDEHLILLRQYEYSLAGIVSTDNKRRIWLLLTPEHEPLVKHMPEGDYRLSLAELKQINSFCEVDAKVLKELLRRTGD